MDEFERAASEARDPQPMSDPLEAIRDELESLWRDLEQAMRDAINGRWSMGCDDVARRIVVLTDIVGPMKWTHCAPDLLRGGPDSVFVRFNAAMGHPVALADVHDIESWMASQHAAST